MFYKPTESEQIKFNKLNVVLKDIENKLIALNKARQAEWKLTQPPPNAFLDIHGLIQIYEFDRLDDSLPLVEWLLEKGEYNVGIGYHDVDHNDHALDMVFDEPMCWILYELIHNEHKHQKRKPDGEYEYEYGEYINISYNERIRILLEYEYITYSLIIEDSLIIEEEYKYITN